MILLIQARQPGDPMATHEAQCIRRRLVDHGERLVVRNALAGLDPRWLIGARAVILGGSGDYSVHHPANQGWVAPLARLLETALERELPGFGICFGHQLLGHVLGSEVTTCPRRTEIGSIPLELTESGREDPLFAPLGPALVVHTGHTDCVTDTPSGTELLATSRTLETQAFRVTGTRFYSTQFHPDLTGEEARLRYLAYADSQGDEAEARRAQQLAGRFVQGRDGSSTLLRAFCELVLGP